MDLGRRSIGIRFSKWGGSPHWAFDMCHLGDDEHGTWLWAPAGTEMRRGNERSIRAKRPFVKVITPDQWWTAIWNGGDPEERTSIEIYVDVCTPAEWKNDEVHMVDLDLDVARRRSGIVEIHDEDEFDEHRVTLGYPANVVDRARTETARLAIAVERRDEPFGLVGQRWLEISRER